MIEQRLQVFEHFKPSVWTPKNIYPDNLYLKQLIINKYNFIKKQYKTNICIYIL